MQACCVFEWQETVCVLFYTLKKSKMSKLQNRVAESAAIFAKQKRVAPKRKPCVLHRSTTSDSCDSCDSCGSCNDTKTSSLCSYIAALQGNACSSAAWHSPFKQMRLFQMASKQNGIPRDMRVSAKQFSQVSSRQTTLRLSCSSLLSSIPHEKTAKNQKRKLARFL